MNRTLQGVKTSNVKRPSVSFGQIRGKRQRQRTPRTNSRFVGLLWRRLTVRRISLDKRLISKPLQNSLVVFQLGRLLSGRWTITSAVPDVCSVLRTYLTPPPALPRRLPDDPRRKSTLAVGLSSFVDVRNEVGRLGRFFRVENERARRCDACKRQPKRVRRTSRSIPRERPVLRPNPTGGRPCWRVPSTVLRFLP